MSFFREIGLIVSMVFAFLFLTKKRASILAEQHWELKAAKNARETLEKVVKAHIDCPRDRPSVLQWMRAGKI